jgi:hypothetical protein
VIERQVKAIQIPFDPSKIEAFFAGLVLFKMKNVTAVPEDEVGDSSVKSLLIGALHKQDGGVFQGRSLANDAGSRISLLAERGGFQKAVAKDIRCGPKFKRPIVLPIMRALPTGPLLAALCLSAICAATCFGQAKNPCEVIKQSEAESVVGVKLQPAQLSPKKTLCKYLEPGYGDDASKKKQVTIGIFFSATPNPAAVNNRRQFISQDQSLLPVTSKDIPNIGDAAIWVWAGGYFGALYAFKSGTLEVTVKISGVPEATALSAAKKFAIRALGGAGKSGYAYGTSQILFSETKYNAPKILGPLYLGTFDPIADDEMTRNYVASLVQAFNGSCSSVPEIFAVMDYAFYYERKASKQSVSAANRGDFDKGFAQVGEQIKRSHPHMLLEGREDAAMFLKLNGQEGKECMTPTVQRL